MPAISALTIGPVHELIFDRIYALPPKRVLIHVQPSSTVIGVSNDYPPGTFNAAALDANSQFEASGGFVLVVIANALVRLTEIKGS